jgi:hypothetical protein
MELVIFISEFRSAAPEKIREKNIFMKRLQNISRKLRGM